jgi:hypothetical protein
MAIINLDGLFSGDRLRRCSNTAQLHWPRLSLASDGFGRLEVNYHKIVSRAYSTFKPAPSERELLGYVQEYIYSPSVRIRRGRSSLGTVGHADGISAAL